MLLSIFILAKKTVVIDSKEYPFHPQFRFPPLTEKRIMELELGITYSELINIVGKPNGELNWNAIPNNTYYLIGINRYVVFHFEWKNNLLWWKNPGAGRLTGIYLYSRDGLIRVISECGTDELFEDRLTITSQGEKRRSCE